MSPGSDFGYQTTELKKSNTISKVEAKQGNFLPRSCYGHFGGGQECSEGGSTKTEDMKKTQCLGVLVKSVRAGLALQVLA